MTFEDSEDIVENNQLFSNIRGFSHIGHQTSSCFNLIYYLQCNEKLMKYITQPHNPSYILDITIIFSTRKYKIYVFVSKERIFNNKIHVNTCSILLNY